MPELLPFSSDIYEFNWREAKNLFEKAIYIKPSYATAHQ